jgi:GTP-binding protein LepA
MTNIRNFCIVAHVDHGKSTLADRFLEITGTVDKREMRSQLLDSMELERERGITIKLTPVRMSYTLNAIPYTLNLIDTPGHVDFNYEVSRSLAAVEGAILLVDATQGIQAQTLGNLYLALEQNLTIVPAINKIDLPAARVAETVKQIKQLLGTDAKDIFLVSAKTGQGVKELLQAVIEKVPAPKNQYPDQTRALIFDSVYDEYRGVVAYVRLMDGSIKTGDKILMLSTQNKSAALEVGFFKPKHQRESALQAGEIGYIVTGLKNIAGAKVGDTITLDQPEALSKTIPLPGYKEIQPMVFAGIFCREGGDFERLREAILKLKLNDAALTFEPEHSAALGFGFRCGFLGLLHLDIFQERLRREYNLDLVVTAPSVAYQVYKTDGTMTVIKSPQDLPEPTAISKIAEPLIKADLVSPVE